MKNGWTGGQYSVFRILFGLYLFVHFAMLLPWGPELFSNSGVLPEGDASPLLRLFPNLLAVADSPAVVTMLLGLALVASMFFTAGAFDRTAAIVIWYVLACTFGRNPLIANPSLPVVGWMLIAHALLPKAPYGSVAAAGRIDPRGGWSYPQEIWRAAWIVMALGYTYSGYTKLLSPSWVDGTALERVLNNPLARPGVFRDAALAVPDPLLAAATWGALGLELLFAPLALLRPLRPWIWLAMLGMHLGLMATIDFADLSFAMVLLHFFTFDPNWVPRLAPSRVERILYDGTCGLCHQAVRFLVAEDSHAAFSFAPLPEDVPQDSVIVEKEEGERLTRSDAARYILARLGGLWRVASWLMAVIPRPIRDAGYDLVARTRYRLFSRPAEACPILPADLRSRFQA